MTILFGVTTPFGMCLGMVLWKRKGVGEDGMFPHITLSFLWLAYHALYCLAPMLLVQGVMSAISAGMLIYASTVEMIAGDFVFGDVEGNHHHHHHEHDGHGPEQGHGGSKSGKESSKKTSILKRALALLSLFAGAGAMVLVGLGE